MNENPYQKYKEAAVMTMTQGEMLLLLYDELLKRLRAAELLTEKKEYDLFEVQVTRAEDIVRYLKNTLDFSYPISNDLYRLYNSFLVELSRIRAGRKKERIEELKELAQELRDGFEEAEKKVAR